MTNTLASIPPSQKATFTKLQASVRSAFHTWTSLRRLQDVRSTDLSDGPQSHCSDSIVLRWLLPSQVAPYHHPRGPFLGVLKHVKSATNGLHAS